MLTAALSFVISLSISDTSVHIAELTPVSQLQGERALNHLVNDLPKTIGLNAGDRLTHIKRFDLRSGFVLRANRTHQGLPVIDQSLAARFDEAGQLVRINTDFSPLSLSTAPAIDIKTAQLNALASAWGFKLPRELAKGKGPQTSLVISPKHNALVYAVMIRGINFGTDRVLLVHAQSGKIVETRSLARHVEATGTAFLPHPSPTGELGSPESVTLTRLNEPEDGAPLVLDGAFVNASNCLTSSDNVRVLTCDDALPIFAGDFLPAGTSCSSSLVVSLRDITGSLISKHLRSWTRFSQAADCSSNDSLG